MRGDADVEYMKRVAEYVDRSMRSIAEKSPTLSPVKTAVLAALNIADELFKERSDARQRLSDVESRADDILAWMDKKLADDSSPKSSHR